MARFWYFTIYSFVGFLLETAFAHITGHRPDRKCLLFLPLCPVYGLGACASLALAPLARENPVLLFLLGAAACTAVEYGMAVWYERGLGVSFWNYEGRRGSFRGRICLPFSAAWGALALCGYWWVHPAVEAVVPMFSAPVTGAAAAVVTLDTVIASLLLRHTGDRNCLRWYDAFRADKDAVQIEG